MKEIVVKMNDEQWEQEEVLKLFRSIMLIPEIRNMVQLHVNHQYGIQGRGNMNKKIVNRLIKDGLSLTKEDYNQYRKDMDGFL